MDDAADAELLDFLTQFLTAQRLRRLEQALHRRTRHLVVVLEDLYNAHNASACLRSCEGFGLQEVHVIESRNAFQVSPKIARGAADWLDLLRHRGGERGGRACLESLRRRGYRLVAATPAPDATSLPQYDVRQKTALLFGNERDGLSEPVMAQVDERLTIPMCGLSESFNISVALAVCLYELTHALRQSNVDWQLSEDDRMKLRAHWIGRAVGARRLPYLRARFRAERGAAAVVECQERA